MKFQQPVIRCGANSRQMEVNRKTFNQSLLLGGDRDFLLEFILEGRTRNYEKNIITLFYLAFDIS